VSGITDVNPYNYSAPGFLGDQSASVTVLFKFTGDTGEDAVLAWAGHISTRADWGNDNSAVAISGASYHTSQESFGDYNASNDLGGGKQDLQLQSSAVIFPATITINKVTDINSTQSFNFELQRPVNTVDVLAGKLDINGNFTIDSGDDGKFVDSGNETFTVVDGAITGISGGDNNNQVNSYFVNNDGLVVSGSSNGPVSTHLILRGPDLLRSPSLMEARLPLMT